MRLRVWIILWLLPLFVACSAVQLSYNQGSMLAYWWLDGYADFSAEQSPRVKAALEDWFVWHRASQLPDYAQALAAMQTLAADKVSPAQICNIVEGWQQRAERAYERALPALAEQVRSMSPEQIRHLERQQAKKHEDAVVEYLQPLPGERQKAAFERALDRAESVYGRLDPAQRRMLASELAASPFDPELWLAERRQRQLDIARSLRQWQTERSDAATVQAGLRRLGTEASTSPRADYRAYAERLMAANCAMLAKLHNSSTPAQRQQAVDKLKGWQNDLRSLLRR